MRKLLVCLVFAALIYSGFTKKPKNKTFIATKDWQEIVQDQPLPAGLHIRLNLETGKKEAKLLDEDEDHANENNKTFGLLEYKGEIDNDVPEKAKNAAEGWVSPERLAKIKNKYKSYKALKEGYDELRKKFKIDAEILLQLLGEFRNASKADTENDAQKAERVQLQLKILESFDYLTHQFDNSLLFIAQGGLDILSPIVANETNVELRIKAMRVLGTLTQNNPHAQVAVFERNFGTYLAKVLITSTNTDELSTALYAFGSLLRKFPKAEKIILSTSGVQALVNVIGKDYELKLKAKAATLISDIILERQEMLDALHPLQVAEVSDVYSELKLAEWLESHEYCKAMESAVSTHIRQLLDAPDIMEYFLHAFYNTRDLCTTSWQNSVTLHAALLTLRDRYSKHDGDESYWGEMSRLSAKVIKAIFEREQGQKHVEVKIQLNEMRHEEL